MLRAPLLLLALCTALPGAWATSAPQRAAFVGLVASVLRIEAPGQRGYAMGSGVVVRADTVVTNCHVTRDANQVFVVRGGVRWAASAQASDLARDICLLHVPGLRASPVEMVSSDALRLGQSVTALGYTGGYGIQTSDGQVVELHRHDGAHVIQSSNWFSSGASGGGLFDDAGRLIGILTFRLRGGEAHYFAAPTDWVNEMLAKRPLADYNEVMPSKTSQVHYWQQRAPDQPMFLKAAALLQDARWAELEALAAQWSSLASDDAEPWHLWGTALAKQGRLPEAQLALQCSLHLDPQRASARPIAATTSLLAPHDVIPTPTLATGCPVPALKP